MARKLQGSVRPYGADGWIAHVGREYLGVFTATEYGSREKAKGAASRTVKAWIAETDKAPDLTFGAFGEAWLERRELGGAVRSVLRERSAWNRHVKPWKCYGWAIRRIKSHHVQELLTGLTEKPAVIVKTSGARDGERSTEERDAGRALSRETVVKVRTLLKLCFGAAKMATKIPTNPVSDEVVVQRVARVSDKDELWSWLTLREIGAVLKTVEDDPRMTAAYTIAIYCGLRKGELIGLRWRDVVFDTEPPEIRIRRSYDGPTKTLGSKRVVPMMAPVESAIRAWRKATKVLNPFGLVFPSASGGCLGKSYHFGWLDHEGRPGVRSRAGVRGYVRFHDLRHTCASHLTQGTWSGLLERKPSREEVRDWLGHSALSVTERYAHLDPDGVRGLIRKTERRRNEESDDT